MKELTERRQKRMNKAEDEKKLISTFKKYDRLMTGKRALNKVELPKPERWGYKRVLVLRDDVARSKEADFLNRILRLVQDVQLSRNKKFETRNYKTKKMEPYGHGPKRIFHKDWLKLQEEGKITKKMEQYFDKVWKFDSLPNGRVNPHRGHWTFVFNRPWMFVSKVEPHYITHRYLINPQIESELQELCNRIETYNLWPKIYKVKGWSYGDRDIDYKKDKLINEAYDRAFKEDLGGNVQILND